MKIGLVGTFDVNNFGDCLFPELYIHELKKRIPDLAFELLSPTANSAEISSYQKVSQIPGTLQSIGQIDSDVLILIGGETISIGHSSGTYIFPLNQFSAALRLWLSPLLASSSANGPKFIVHSVGIAIPIERAATLIAVALGQVNRLSFRDSFSSDFISQHGVDNQMDVDPVFRISLMRSPGEWKALAENYLPPNYLLDGFFIAQISIPYLNGNIEDWCKQVEKISKAKNLKVVLLPICHFLHDEILLKKAKKILEHNGVEALLIKGLLNVNDTVSIFSQSSGYCGTSLHGAVVAISFAKPVAVLSTSLTGKHEGVMNSVGLENIVATNIDDLSERFYACEKYNLHEIQIFSIQQAGLGLERLVKAIHSEKRTVTIDPDLIEDLVKIDISKVSYSFFDLKRNLLKLVKNSKISGKLYFWLISKMRNKI